MKIGDTQNYQMDSKSASNKKKVFRDFEFQKGTSEFSKRGQNIRDKEFFKK